MNKSGKIVTKGEIARFEQFLHLSLGFKKPSYADASRKRLYEGKG